MDAQRLDREWRARLTTHPIDPRMQFADDGLVLGVGTVLAPAANSARDISIDISQPRLLALLAAAHLREATPLGLAHIRKAVSHWREGDAALASMHLALSGLARLERPVADARRLFLADRFLSEGLEAEFIVSELGHGSSSDGLSKSSADQPRVPAGSGRASGQWTTGATSPSGPPTSSPSPLAPRQRGSGGRHAAPTRTQLVRPQGPRLLSNPLFRPRASRAGAAGQAATDRGLDTRTFRVELPFAIIGAATRPLTAFGQAVKRVADSVEIADSISKWRELGAKGEIAMLAAVEARGWMVIGQQVYVRTALGLRVEDLMVHVPVGTAGNATAYDGFIEVKVNGGQYSRLQRAKDALIGAVGGVLLTPIPGYKVGSRIVRETGLANVTITRVVRVTE